MSSVTRFPTTNNTGTWATPNNAHADDGNDTTGTGTEDTLWGTLGFDGVIPVGATINSVTVTVEDGLAEGTDHISSRPRVGGVDQTSRQFASGPQTYPHVDTNDHTADRSWVRADLLDGTFEVRLVYSSLNSNLGRTDYVKVTVDYTSGPNNYLKEFGAVLGSGGRMDLFSATMAPRVLQPEFRDGLLLALYWPRRQGTLLQAAIGPGLGHPERTRAPNAPVSGNVWMDPQNAYADDSLYATQSLKGGGGGFSGEWVGFNFDSILPSTANISRVEVLVRIKADIEDPGAAAYVNVRTNIYDSGDVLAAKATKTERTYAVDVTNALTPALILGTATEFWDQFLVAGVTGTVGSNRVTWSLNSLAVRITWSSSPGGITYVGGSTAAGTDASQDVDVVLNVPANVVEGDLMMVAQFEGITITIPAGWSTIPGGLGPGHGFYRFAGSGEPANYSWHVHNPGSPVIANFICDAFRGVDRYAPFETPYSANSDTTTAVEWQSPGLPRIATVTPGTMILAQYINNPTNETNCSTPAGYTSRANLVGDGCGMQSFTKLKAVPGDEAPTATDSTLPTPDWVAMLIGLRPDTGADEMTKQTGRPTSATLPLVGLLTKQGMPVHLAATLSLIGATFKSARRTLSGLLTPVVVALNGWARVGPTLTSSNSGVPSPWAVGALGNIAIGDSIIMVLTLTPNQSSGLGATGFTTVTDTLGNQYSPDLVASTNAANSELRYSVWRTVSRAAGNPTISASFDGPTPWGLSVAIAAYRGISGVDISKVAIGTAGGTNAADSGTTSATTTAANELKLGLYGDRGRAQTVTAGTLDTTYTLVAFSGSSGGGEAMIEEADSGSAGSTARATSTNLTGSSSSWAQGVIVYQLSPGFIKKTQKALAATASFVGATFKRFPQDLAATLSFVGTRTWAWAKSLTATLALAGAVTKQTARSLAGVVPMNSGDIAYKAKVQSDANTYAYWRLAETSGTSAADIGKFGTHTGTYTQEYTLNQPSLITDARDRAITLSGTASGGYVDTDNMNLNAATALTVEAWIKPTNVSTGHFMVTKWDASQQCFLFHMADFTSGDLAAYICPTATSFSEGYTATGAITVNQLHHVAFVYNGAGAANADRLKIYVNAVEKTLTFVNTIPASIGGSTARVQIGHRVDHTGLRFAGDIDEVAIYGTVFTQAMIQEHYDLGRITREGLTAKVSKPFAGVLSFVGALANSTRKALGATLPTLGSLVKFTSRTLAATLSFVGDTARQYIPFAIQKALSATLSFAGAVTKQTTYVMPATIALLGAATKSTSRTLAATASFVGTTTKQTSRSLAATLPLVGSFLRGRVMTATLSFVGATAKSTSRTLTATVALAGTLPWQLARALSATLSLAGVVTKLTARTLAATLPLAGLMTTIKAFGRQLAGTLSFAGATAKQTTHVMPATLALVGAATRAITHGLAATLALLGATTKRTSRSLAATLPLIGAATKQVGKTLAGTVSFVGAITRGTGKALAATLPLVGAITKRAVTRTVAATLALVGTTLKQTNRTLVAAFLGLVGAVVTLKAFGRTLSATLSFSGAQTRQTGKALGATLALVGAITSRAIVHQLAATLALAGTVARQTRRTLAATLALLGSLASSHIFAKALAATLSFVGAVTKQTTHALAGTLPSTGAVTRRVGKLLSATLAPFGATLRFLSKKLAAATLGLAGVAYKQTRKIPFLASLTFTSFFDASKSTIKMITLAATLAFNGAIKRMPVKALAGTLSFAGTAAPNWLGRIRGATRYVVAVLGLTAYLAAHRGAETATATIRSRTAYFPAIRGRTSYNHA